MASKEFRGQPIKDLRGFLTEVEVRSLIEGTESLEDKVLLRLLYVTGARVSEIVGDKAWRKNHIFEPARVQDINFEDGNILLNLLKRKQYPPPKHLVPLDKKTQQYLKKLIREQKLQATDPLFKMSRTTVFRRIRKIGESLGIDRVGTKGLHPHHMRHTHCVTYIRKNNTLEGLRKLQQALGHSSIGITAYYLQFGPEAKKETEDVFGKW